QHRAPPRHRSGDDEETAHRGAGRERAVGEQTMITDRQAETGDQPHRQEQGDVDYADRAVEQSNASIVPKNGNTSKITKCRRCNLCRWLLLITLGSRIEGQAVPVPKQPYTVGSSVATLCSLRYTWGSEATVHRGLRIILRRNLVQLDLARAFWSDGPSRG